MLKDRHPPHRQDLARIRHLHGGQLWTTRQAMLDFRMSSTSHLSGLLHGNCNFQTNNTISRVLARVLARVLKLVSFVS